LALWSLVGLVAAQDEEAEEAAPSVQVMQAPQPGQAPAGAQAPPSPRLSKLQQLAFDRRPSAMLRAWAAPEPKFTEEAPPPEPIAPPTSQPTPESAPSEPQDGAEAPPAPDPERAAREAKRQTYEAKKLQFELELLQRDVTLGRWTNVSAAIAAFAEAERKPAYERLLRALVKPPQDPANQQVPPQLQEQNAFTFHDLLGLAGAAPGGLQKTQVELLAPLCKLALAGGHVLEELLALLQREVEKPAGEAVFTARNAALLLAAIGREADLGPFLPSAERASADNDREALNLLARHRLARYATDQDPAHLESAWSVTQAALAAGEVDEKDKADALRRAVELAPKISAELGRAWLEESFTVRPERGMEIIATIGAQAAKGFQQHAANPGFRQKGLELQKTAVAALLQRAPERAEEWRNSLNLLAENWIAEARYAQKYSSAQSLGPRMRRDPYGNIYYVQSGSEQGGNVPVQPIDPAELLKVRPEGKWVDLLDASLRPHFAMVAAQLYLKVNEEKLAFPYIEELARTHPQKGKELVDEFLRVWTRNHNPNVQRDMTDPYMFMYGFDQRASGIPLTRSKQERSLAELAEWVPKLRALPIAGGLDEQLLANAFMASHSNAEVYRLETMQRVFGSMEEMSPATIARLAQTMRQNLATVWRRTDVQDQARTRRRPQDIEREVDMGYAVATAVVASAVQQHPNDWRLMAVTAALVHDQNNFRQEIGSHPEFAGRRKAALAAFQEAAKVYAAQVETLPAAQQTAELFEQWFYAGLGACDLGAIDARTTADEAQPPLIRAALEALPGEAAARHVTMFANDLFTRLSAVNPAVKYRYLRAGFDIVGDHPQAFEARKVFDYYNDLVTEIRLDAVVDGPDVVGHEHAFGVAVNLRHTREIERESGGFAKYLQNQNSMQWAYNYGRPLENYRDKFQEAATQALQEQFEVLSVTFNSDKARSKADDEYGWRVTPYAYLLLRARGPEVDRIPPLRLDLDFLDTSGYAVIPVVSAAVPIDASREPEEARPYEELAITQTLDERRADEGVLVLDMKASARGLVPELRTVLDFAPPEFDVVKSDAPGVAVTRFADDQSTVLSERTWTITLAAKPELARAPREFAFAKPRSDDIEVVYQRYADADLVTAPPVVSLEQTYGTDRWPWPLFAVAGAAVIALGAAFVWFRRRRGETAEQPSLRVPEHVTAFTVLGFLRQIRDREIAQAQRGDLDRTIADLERCYFAQNGDTPHPDLRRIAEEWLARAGR
jgi:hypothetical protein